MGTGLERISAGIIFSAACAAGRDCTVGGAGTSASPNPACSVTVARSSRHIESASLRDIDGFILACLCGHAIRIAEAASLHPLRGAVNGLRRRAPCGKYVGPHNLLWNHRTCSWGQRIKLSRRDLHFGSRRLFHLRFELRSRSWQTQSLGRRIELCHQDWFTKLSLRLVIYRDRCGNEFDRMIVKLWALKNLRVENGDPHKNRNHNRLDAIAQHKIGPWHLPWRERREDP